MMVVKEYRIEYDKDRENLLENRLFEYCKKNKIRSIIRPLYLENDKTLRIVVLTTEENHKKLKDAGFTQV